VPGVQGEAGAEGGGGGKRGGHQGLAAV